MYSHETKYRVCYGDTDQMGVVYYGNYPRLYEIGRTELMRTLGLSYKEIEAQGIALPVCSLNVRYHRPALYDDVLTIRTIVKDIPNARIQFYYEILNEAGKVINTGDTVLAFIDTQTQRPTRVPETILHLFQENFAVD
ncbi:MAG: acyl-CoA thioesterase [Marinifilaceae bacterium]